MRRPFALVVFCLLPVAPFFSAKAEEVEEPANTASKVAEPMEADPSLINGATVEARALAFLRYQATTTVKDSTYPKHAISKYLSRLLTRTDTDYAVSSFEKAAITTLAKSKSARTITVGAHALDPFDKHALMHAWLICHAQITAATTQAIHDYMSLWSHKVWKGYGAMNYRLMMDGSGFLAAEQWPDLIDADQLNAQAIKEITKQRLFGYFDDIVHHNFGEYEAPTYYGIDLAAMKMLADHAQDVEMKKRATLTLDWMLLNIACSWNQGYNTSSCGRAKYWVSTNTSPEEMDSTAAIGWIYFGGKRPVRASGMNDGGSIWFAYRGDYHPPEILNEIANDRGQPVLHQGTVLLGTKDQVRLTIFHTPGYSLASQWEFLGNETNGLYKETRREMLKWISDKPSSTFCPMQDNPRRPYALEENVANAWGYGENPFGQSLQSEGTLIGVYSVPEDYPYYKLYAPFSQSGSILKRVEKEGWIFCHAGSMLFAFHPVKAYTWGKPQQGEDVLWSDFRKNGWVLETSLPTPYAGGGTDQELNRFITAILTKTKIDASQIDADPPRLVFTSLTGHQLDLTFRPHGQAYKNQNQIDGKTVEYESYPLLGNPWVQQPVNGDLLSIHHGNHTLEYDFKNWSRTN